MCKLHNPICSVKLRHHWFASCTCLVNPSSSWGNTSDAFVLSLPIFSWQITETMILGHANVWHLTWIAQSADLRLPHVLSLQGGMVALATPFVIQCTVFASDCQQLHTSERIDKWIVVTKICFGMIVCKGLQWHLPCHDQEGSNQHILAEGQAWSAWKCLSDHSKQICAYWNGGQCHHCNDKEGNHLITHAANLSAAADEKFFTFTDNQTLDHPVGALFCCANRVEWIIGKTIGMSHSDDRTLNPTILNRRNHAMICPMILKFVGC